MKIPFLFVALLFAPALAPADDAPASVPAPTAAPEAFPKTTAFRQQVLEKLQNVTLPPNVQAALAPVAEIALGEQGQEALQAVRTEYNARVAKMGLAI